MILVPQLLLTMAIATSLAETAKKYCVKKDTRLSNHVLRSRAPSSKLQCVHWCAYDEQCVSVNYERGARRCTMNGKRRVRADAGDTSTDTAAEYWDQNECAGFVLPTEGPPPCTEIQTNGGRCMKILGSNTWANGRSGCAGLGEGWGLARLLPASEVYNDIKSALVSNGKTDCYFIGLHNTNSQWKWIDGTAYKPSDYSSIKKVLSMDHTAAQTNNKPCVGGSGENEGICFVCYTDSERKGAICLRND